ncbi:MAG TPA: RHS repeat-associated core domain-containing protein, partial [Polyangiales bacterium]
RLPDAVGNLFRREDRRDRKYGPAGQLLEAHGTEGITDYRYDAEGNLTEKEEPGQRLWRYRWNGAGMLTHVVRPDGEEVSFAYDALGRRIAKSHGGTTTRWLWDGNVPLHEWVEPERPTTWLFEPESFAPLAKLSGVQRCAIVTDHLGTPVRMLEADGSEVWASEIDTYGALRELRGERAACPFRWPGQYEDAETGLYYNRFRYYDPDAGQYLAQDPIGLLGGAALYAYVQDPTNAYDPIGLSEWLVRYTDEAEAQQSAGNLGGDNNLHPKKHGSTESKGPKWVTEKGGERRVTNKKVRMDIEVTDGTTAWLRSNNVDFDDVDSESAAPDKVLRKANEPGSHGVGRNLLPALNERITRITATTEGGGGSRRGRRGRC